MKNKIIDNAITLFSEKGYYGTTLDDIAKSVNIKKASLYYHYNNKEEIYRRSVENCLNYFKTFILENNNNSNYSIDELYQFLFEFIFDIDERYIRLYVQLSSAPEELSSEIQDYLKEVNDVLDSEIVKYYHSSEISMDKEDFRNLILLFLESWYLKASFSQRFSVIEENKNCYKDQVYSLLNVFIKK